MRQDAETGDAESRGAGQSRFPPPTEYLYPFGDEPGQITAEIALSFGPGTDLSAARIEIPPLKYNKSLLLLLTLAVSASMLTMWVVRVLLAYVLGKYMGYGVIGVWFAHAIVDWSVRSVIFFLRYRSGKWETMGIKT